MFKFFNLFSKLIWDDLIKEIKKYYAESIKKNGIK